MAELVRAEKNGDDKTHVTIELKTLIVIVAGIITAFGGTNYFTKEIAGGTTKRISEDFTEQVRQVIKEEKDIFTAEEVEEEYQSRRRQEYIDGALVDYRQDINNLQQGQSQLRLQVQDLKVSVDVGNARQDELLKKVDQLLVENEGE